jgi:hypothetical protein
VVAVLVLAATLVSSVEAETRASRIVDRTFSCATGYVGGIYQVSVRSHWYEQAGRRQAFASITTILKDGFLGSISSRSLSVNRLHCRATRQQLPLTTRGLRGGAFSMLPVERDCFTPRRVLVRIRGAFRKPTELKSASPFGYPQLQATGAAMRTELVVGTPDGKPIAYASIAGSKKARLFTSSDCEED